MRAAEMIEYLFVDGASLTGYLDSISQKFFNSHKFEVDLTNEARRYAKVFYYDAIPCREPQEKETDYEERIEPQRKLFTRLRATDGVHVYEGDARRRGSAKKGLQQKMVDVMLTVDMLTHSFRRNMQRATLYTGDQDFKPLVDALVQEGMVVTLWYPPGQTNSDLIFAADRRRAITLVELSDLLTVESREYFKLPTTANFNPNIEPGTKCEEWFANGIRHNIYKCDNGDWVITRDHNNLNRFHMRHPNWGLVLVRATECDIAVPKQWSTDPPNVPAA